MVPLSTLWLPILLSAALVFVASSVIHMLLRFHKNEYRQLPAENAVLAAMRAAGVTRGQYAFPHARSLQDTGSPEMLAKYREGPCGYLTVMPNAAPAVGKGLLQWFVYAVVVSVCVAYVTGRTLGLAADYLAVFRIAGTVAFLAYAAAVVPNAIWMGTPWSTTLKHVCDGLVYGLLTGGAFGWLWPS